MMKASLSTATRRLLIRPAIVARAYSSSTPSLKFLDQRDIQGWVDEEKRMMRNEKVSNLVPESTAHKQRRAFFSTQSDETPHNERELQGGLNAEQLLVLDKMFGKLENLEEQVRVLRKRVQELDPTFAVDAPDGDSLGHELEEKLEIDHIIEEAALHEDKEQVEKAHKLEKEVKKFHARDPEHDW